MSERAENLRNMIASKEKLINEGVGEERKAELQTEVTILQQELDGLQELPEVEEVNTFETDGILEQISELRLFEAIEPEPEDGERIHEYEERRKEHNLIIYMLAQDLLGAQKARYDVIISTKDVEYLSLAGQLSKQSVQVSGLEEVVSELRSQLQDETIRANNAETETEEANTLTNQLQDRVRELEADNEQLTQTIKKLESQIEASKPVEVASSTGLQERVANLKAKSKSADDFMKHFYERNNMTMPEVEMPEVQTEESFQSETESLPDVQPAADGSNHEDQQPAVGTAETFEERTERRLNAIEHRLNKNEPEYVYEAEVA